MSHKIRLMREPKRRVSISLRIDLGRQDSRSYVQHSQKDFEEVQGRPTFIPKTTRPDKI